MPLNKQNISISFGSGIDTKTDPNQVLPGKLLDVQNALFSENLALIKRNGFGSLTGSTALSSSGFALGTYQDELVILSSTSLLSYSAYNQFNQTKATFYPVDLSVSSVVRNQNQQTFQDSAYNSNTNQYLHVYYNTISFSSTANNSIGYVVTDAVTGNEILSGTLNSAFLKPRALSLGNFFLIPWVDTTTSPYALGYTSINATNDKLVNTTYLDTGTMPTSAFNYDCCVSASSAFFAWESSSGANFGIRSTIIDNTLAVTVPGGGYDVNQSAQGFISVWPDTNNTLFWVVVYDGVTTLKYFIKQTDLANNTNPTIITSTKANIVNANGFGISGRGAIYYQINNKYPYAAGGVQIPSILQPTSDFIETRTLTNAGIVSSSALFLRGVGLTSKVNLYQNRPHFVVAYGASFQGLNLTNARSQGFEPTYFVVNAPSSAVNQLGIGTLKPSIIAKLAVANGGGYSSSGTLCNFNQISSSGQYQFDYLIKDLAISQNTNFFINPTSAGLTPIPWNQVGTVPIYTQTGVNSCNLSLENNSFITPIEMGKTLNINSGYLEGYDGISLTENNFHLFPEDIVLSTSGYALGATATGIELGANNATSNYTYVATYEWTDNQGNVHRSAPSVPTSITIEGGSTTAIVFANIPTARLTNKSNVFINLYRNAPSISASTYYLVTTLASSGIPPIANDVTIDNVTVRDSIPDRLLNGNTFLYTTGGVLENIGAPAFSAISRYKNRVIGVQSENKNVLWYSKEVLQGTPVEFSDVQTIFVNTKFGNVTALAEMDDKFIIFKKDKKSQAIYYITGQGPDATGANNDFSEPIFITSLVSTSNPRSVLLTQDGVIFQSDSNGIWLLDRGLGVSYIGAPVEAYNSFIVTSAVLLPNSTQIRLTLNNGQALMYDYFNKQWGVFSNTSAVHSVIWNGLHTYLQSGGSPLVLQETPGVYSDNGSPIFMSLKTSWLSISGLQGFERAYRLYLMGQYVGSHNMTVSVGYDFNNTPSQRTVITPINPSSANDVTFEQWRVNLTKQKCESIQIAVQEGFFDSSSALTAGPLLENLGLLIGTKLTYPKLPATLSVK